MGKIIKKIVLTGGPSSGKSSSLETIREYLTDKGYLVYTISESATELMEKGFIPGKNGVTDKYFQEILLKHQIYKENLMETIAKSNNGDRDVIILCDRGILDSKAYINSKEFYELLNKLNLKELDLLNRYDLVIHLETGAKSKYYRTDNNPMRRESEDRAILKDDETFDAWKLHRNLKRIKCYDIFEEKQDAIISVCKNFLTNNYKKQYKYLVDKDRFIIYPSFYDDRVEIEQYYLDFCDNYEHRIRKIVKDNTINYIYTIQKKEKYGVSKIIYDNPIDSKLFDYLISTNRIINKINKKRYYIINNDIVLYLDVFDNGNIILESNDSNFDIKRFNVIKDVTDNNDYLNININDRKELVLKK